MGLFVEEGRHLDSLQCDTVHFTQDQIWSKFEHSSQECATMLKHLRTAQGLFPTRTAASSQKEQSWSRIGHRRNELATQVVCTTCLCSNFCSGTESKWPFWALYNPTLSVWVSPRASSVDVDLVKRKTKTH